MTTNELEQEFSNNIIIPANKSIEDKLPFVVSFVNAEDDIIIDILLNTLFSFIKYLIQIVTISITKV